MIDDRQVEYFKAFGFLVLRNLFSADEVRTIRSEFDYRAEIASGYEPYDGTKVCNMVMMGNDTPFFASLLEDDRFLQIAQKLYGDVTGDVVTADRRMGDTVWHHDAGGYDEAGVRFAFYPQPLTAQTGALRLLGGSHLQPWHNQLDEMEPIGAKWYRHSATEQEKALANATIDKIPAYVCETEPGDVIACDLRTFHASCGGNTDRHMCSLMYFKYPQTPAEIELTISQAKGWTSEKKRLADPWNPALLRSCWEEDLDRHPLRKLWIERMQHFSQMPEGQNGVRAVAVNGKLRIVAVEPS